MKQKVYMRTTVDEYELPVAVADSPGELARITGTTKGSVLSLISHKIKGWYRVEIEVKKEKTERKEMPK